MGIFHQISSRYFSTKPLSKNPNFHELNNLCSKGYLNQAFHKFKPEIWTDPNLFTPLIQGCITQKSLLTGKQLHSIIIVSGCFLDKFLNNHLMNMYGKLGDVESMLGVYNVMGKRNIMSSNILINGYTVKGDLDRALKMFDEMPVRNVATWNAMVTGLIQLEENGKGFKLFSEMFEDGFFPDEYALGSVFRGCAGLRDLEGGKQVHSFAIKSGHETGSIVGSALANMYMRCNCLVEGERVVKAMPVLTVPAYNTLIAGLAQNGFPEDALKQYNLMKKSKFQPDKITFVSVLSSCSDLATLGQGQQIHAEVIKHGDTSVDDVVSTLISMYSKCGCLEDSIKAFRTRKVEDIVIWTSMIAAYGFHGKGDKVIEVFNQMEGKQIQPTSVTFLSLLYAFSHCGMKEKGIEFLDLMVKKYGINPSVEHYTCVVDLLGRAGCLSEAEEMIRSMPVKPDSVIWKVLLSACKTHKDADMANRIAEEIMKFGPLNAASYVLLANIQATAKRWDEVSTMRKAIKDLRVKKEPGISWFEFRNQFFQFTMGDKSNYRWKEIEFRLKELMLEIRKCGYKPDYASVLHNIGNDEKEESLMQHSEKLAVVFALMIIPAGFPIRVMKNLRICDDCHLAFKYITKVKDREIIVRDASRFHHFKDGSCSCDDFW